MITLFGCVVKRGVPREAADLSIAVIRHSPLFHPEKSRASWLERERMIVF